MQINLEGTTNQFGESWVVIAVLDRYHKPLFREFYSYDDAYALACKLLKQPLDDDSKRLFQRK